MNMEEYAVQKFYNSWIMSYYRDGRFKKAAKMSGVEDKDVVLDFGCYVQRLKRFLPSVKYYGYDQNKQFSNVKGWKKLKNVDIVFAMAVFEHLPEKELEATIAQFKKMRVKRIVAEFPWEDSIVNRFMCWLMGVKFEHYLTHPSGWRIIAKALNKEYECIMYKHFLWATWITIWEPRKK